MRDRKTYRHRDDQYGMFVLSEMIKVGKLLLTEQGVLTHKSTLLCERERENIPERTRGTHSLPSICSEPTRFEVRGNDE